jgi:hypothetical protein
MGMDTKHPLLALCEALAAHQDVTHFAISMRIMAKGDFFKGLMRPGADCRTRTATRVLDWFDANWPEDLEWPRQIPRPQKKKEAA